MAQLIVRNLDADVKERLRRRAALRGRSMEEEVRDILRAAADQDVEVPSGYAAGTSAVNQRRIGTHADSRLSF